MDSRWYNERQQKTKNKTSKNKHCTGGKQVKYTKAERLDIGRRVYNGEMTTLEAVAKFGVGRTSIENYIRAYRISNGLPARSNGVNPKKQKLVVTESTPGYSEFDSMTREELIGEIIKARINEARAKKGYVVKGDGAEKVYEPIENENTK